MRENKTDTVQAEQRGSSSIDQPTYWWYRARSRLLYTMFAKLISPGTRVVDVGSADGPSVRWLDELAERIPIDIDRRVLHPGSVCASAHLLPLRADSIPVLCAFDVIEHFEDEARVLRELARAIEPGGLLLASVPAYQWAWSAFDLRAGHHRRYTRRRLVAAVEEAGLDVVRATYAFGATFPLFILDRIMTKARRPSPDQVTLPRSSPAAERMLMALSGLDDRLLRRRDLPFGSSVFVAASKGPWTAPRARPQASSLKRVAGSAASSADEEPTRR